MNWELLCRWIRASFAVLGITCQASVVFWHALRRYIGTILVNISLATLQVDMGILCSAGRERQPAVEQKLVEGLQGRQPGRRAPH